MSLQQVNKCTLRSAFGRSFVVFEVLREDEFSPLKNADGAATDSPTTARNALLAQHSRWATAAGATLLDEHGNLLPPTARSDENVLINTLLYQITSKTVKAKRKPMQSSADDRMIKLVEIISILTRLMSF